MVQQIGSYKYRGYHWWKGYKIYRKTAERDIKIPLRGREEKREIMKGQFRGKGFFGKEKCGANGGKMGK